MQVGGREARNKMDGMIKGSSWLGVSGEKFEYLSAAKIMQMAAGRGALGRLEWWLAKRVIRASAAGARCLPRCFRARPSGDAFVSAGRRSLELVSFGAS